MAGHYLVYVVTLKPDGTTERSSEPVGVTHFLEGRLEQKQKVARSLFKLSVTQMPYLVEIGTQRKRQIDRAIESAAKKGREISVAEALKILKERAERRRERKLAKSKVA